MFFDQVLAFDHVKKEIYLIVTADLVREGREGAYDEQSTAKPAGEEAGECIANKAQEESAREAQGFSAYIESLVFEAVEAKEYIASGDVLQCVLAAT